MGKMEPTNNQFKLNVRAIIAERLLYEFRRRNIENSHVAAEANLPVQIIGEYLDGKKEIKFDEVKSICNVLGINPVRLIFGREYPKVKIAFRNIGSNIQKIASSIEDVFLLIEDTLPTTKLPNLTRKTTAKDDKTTIISEASSLSKKLREKFPNPLVFFQSCNIKLLPISHNNADFDAFLLHHNDKIAVCLNTAKPPCRIIFTLAHEIAHILFDHDKEVPIDTFVPNFYWNKRISQHDFPEYFAYKFAEFYLIPFDSLHVLINSWPSINLKKAQSLIEENLTSKDVLANALYDYFQMLPPTAEDGKRESTGEQFRRIDFEAGNNQPEYQNLSFVPFSVLSRTLNSLHNSNRANQIVSEFMLKAKQSLERVITEHCDNYSDDVLAYISEKLQLGLR